MMSEQQSMFHESRQQHADSGPPPFNPENRVHNPDPREAPPQGAERAYQAGYDGPAYNDFAQPQMRGEKLSPRQQPRRRAPWAALIPVIILLALLTGVGGWFGQSNGSQLQKYAVGPQARVNIHSFNGNVHVRTGDTNVVLVESHKRGFDFSSNDKPVEIVQKQDDLTIDTKASGGWFNPANVDLDVTVPANTVVNIQADDGNVVVTDVQGDIYAGSGDGNVEITNAQGKVDVKSSDGNVDINNDTVHNGPVRVSVGDGNIHVDKVSGQLTLNTGDGNIDVNESTIKGESSLHSDNGNIVFHGSLDPKGTGYRFETYDGNVDLSLPADSNFNLKEVTADRIDNDDFPVNGNSNQVPVTVIARDGNAHISKD